MDGLVQCPLCNGGGREYAGYYYNEELDGSSGPAMNWCSLCDGVGKVSVEVETQYICDRIPD